MFCKPGGESEIMSRILSPVGQKRPSTMLFIRNYVSLFLAFISASCPSTNDLDAYIRYCTDSQFPFEMDKFETFPEAPEAEQAGLLVAYFAEHGTKLSLIGF